MALCQARQDSDADGHLDVGIVGHGEADGDRLRAYYVERSGEGTPIDAFVDTDPTGRFVAFIRDGRLVLRDTHAQLETDLSALDADARRDLLSYAPHRAGAFHPDGGYFAYIRTTGPRTVAVVRELSSGREREIDPGAGSLWRIEFEPDGAFLHLRVVAKDTNGDGKVRWPVPLATNESSVCRLPVPRFVVGDAEPDRVSHLLYRMSDGKLFERAGFVMAVGEHLLTRTEEGELWLEEKDGARRMISGRDCLGRVLHAVGPSATLLLGCTSEYGQRRRLELATGSRNLRLGYEVAGFESDGRYPGAPRYLVLNPGNESILADTVTGRVTKLPPGTSLIASHGGTLLVERQSQLLFLGSEGTERALATPRARLSRVMQAGRYVTVGALWFDLQDEEGPVALPGEPLALAATGAVLLGQRAVTSAGPELLQGPFQWFTPEPTER